MANGGIDSVEFFSALDAMAKERRINKEVLFSAIESALISAYKKNFGKTANVRAVIDPQKGQVEVYSRKMVVEEVNDPQCEMSLADAREIRPQYELGDLVEVPVTPRNFVRIAAQTGKQVVVQHLREAERGVISIITESGETLSFEKKDVAIVRPVIEFSEEDLKDDVPVGS